MTDITQYYGYDTWYHKPSHKGFKEIKERYFGFKVFQTEAEALAHYTESKKEAMKILDSHVVKAKEALSMLKAKGIILDAWATCSDDQGLESGLGVSCTVNGFYFHKDV